MQPCSITTEGNQKRQGLSPVLKINVVNLAHNCVEVDQALPDGRASDTTRVATPFENAYQSRWYAQTPAAQTELLPD